MTSDLGRPPTTQLKASGATDKGRIRPTNEDSFAVREDLRLCVIADGMGGHNAGEVASRVAVDAVVECCSAVPDSWPFGYDDSLSADGNLLRTALHRANLSILETAITSDRYIGMGTTLVIARVTDGHLAVAHAGDSRLYLFRDRRLRQITQDDSWIATMLAADAHVDQETLMNHPMRNALTNVVGTGARTEAHVVEEPTSPGDLLLLTTDGVHGVLEADQLAGMVGDGDDLEAIAKRLVDAAMAAGSRDNCTAIVAKIG